MRWSSSGLAKDIDQLHNLRAVFTVRIILGFTFDTIYSGLSWRDGEMLLGHDPDQIEIFMSTTAHWQLLYNLKLKSNYINY